MDDNKLKVLRSIGYKIKACCMSCKWAQLTDNWGTCYKHKYNHLKHTGDNRHLSIHSTGYCSTYQMKEQFDVAIHGFKEFMEK